MPVTSPAGVHPSLDDLKNLEKRFLQALLLNDKAACMLTDWEKRVYIIEIQHASGNAGCA